LTSVKRLLATIDGGRERLAEAVRSARADIEKIEGLDEEKVAQRHREGKLSDRRFEELRRQCLTPAARQSAVAAVREELAESVREIGEDGEDALEQIRSAAPRRPELDPGQAGRIWARLHRRLDAGESSRSVAQVLVERGDRQAMQTLAEELPDYLEAKVHAAGMDRRLIPAEMKALREVEKPLLTDEETEHRETLRLGERANSLLATNAGLVAKDAETTEAIFGETPEMTIHIKED
jgi:hypothetical protein